jgi:two-component SAPR family response regulator
MQADTFLVKPVTEYQLREAVSRLLQGKRGSNESGEEETYE